VLLLVFPFADFSEYLLLLHFISAAASNPKDSKQMVEKGVVGDDAVTEQDVPSIIVDPLLSSTRATPGQTPPSTGLQASMAASGVAPGQTSPLAGRQTPMSALGAALAPKALKAKKLSI
jgi:hypothetical protein